jgi:hypothetical protein
VSEKPHRAYTLFAQIGADTPQDMVRALESIIFDIKMDDMPQERVTGGFAWGGIFAYLTDADMTHETWEAILEAWIAERKKEEESHAQRELWLMLRGDHLESCEVMGLFESEEEAESHCTRPNDYIGPLTVGEFVGDPPVPWLRSHYPAFKQPEEPHP